MEATDKPQFTKLLTTSMGAYGKPLPEPALLKTWWEILAPYPLAVVAAAMTMYCDEQDRFEPKPVSIAKRCKQMDGRPTDDEAWAIALLSVDESDTVVWTQETAEAFAICSTVLRAGDEVGARMAFKDAYNRLVTAARQAGKPAKWSASLGWDTSKREAAVAKAVNAGLLPAPTARTLLPNFSDGSPESEPCPAGLAMVKAKLAELQAGWKSAADRRAAAAAAEREAVAGKKQDIASQVTAYQQGKSKEGV
jgi:hypothetical protein